jgi:arylsulfatase A-like enzyme/endonuclease/exonuclease/phosphatase family metal-dependent hydrolase
MRRVLITAVLAVLLWQGGGDAARAADHQANSPPQRPNIIFILADDIGYGDFGCYGATCVKTPHVDRLAREGLRFTDAHSTASVCTPTRYAFITGQYAWRNPAGAAILSGEAPLAIDPAMPTTASVLKQAGYTTGLVGKWHIGLGKGDLDYNKDIKPGPLEVGFDYAFYFPATGDRVPCVFIENYRVVGLDPADPIRVSYRTKIGDEPTGKDHPELLKMHPSHGHADTIINGISRIGFMSGGVAARWKDEGMADTLAGKAVAFIERNRERPFFLYFATHDIHVPRVPGPRFAGTSQCGTRCDVIQQFDGCVGQVLATLDRLKLAENTLVIVTSDNGGVMDDGYQDGSGQDRSGHRCNGPLRGYKGSLWEGGHRVPFIARWPGKVKAGAESPALIGLVDMLATFAAVAGRDRPPGAGADSVNVLPALLGEKAGRDHLVVQTNGIQRQAIRKGFWKLIPGKGGGELYNLADDLAETKNLAAQHPELVNELSALLAQARARPNLKLLTWNIQMLPTALDRFSKSLQREQKLRAPWVIEYLNRQDYDMIVLQEVIDPAITASLKQGLKERYPYIVAPKSKLGVAGASGGILFASKVPIQYVAHVVYKNVAGVDTLAEKGCTLVEAEKDGVRFQIAGTHLQAGHQEMKEREYVELYEGIVKPHKKDGVPQVLAGDFNTKPGTDEFQLLLKTTKMRDFPIDDEYPYTIDANNSWKAGKKNPSKPDHVLLNPRGTGTTIVRQTIQRAWKQHEGKRIDLADHYGIVAEILLRK